MLNSKAPKFGKPKTHTASGYISRHKREGE